MLEIRKDDFLSTFMNSSARYKRSMVSKGERSRSKTDMLNVIDLKLIRSGPLQKILKRREVPDQYHLSVEGY
jgi:hypothetical protein